MLKRLRVCKISNISPHPSCKGHHCCIEENAANREFRMISQMVYLSICDSFKIFFIDSYLRINVLKWLYYYNYTDNIRYISGDNMIWNIFVATGSLLNYHASQEDLRKNNKWLIKCIKNMILQNICAIFLLQNKPRYYLLF